MWVATQGRHRTALMEREAEARQTMAEASAADLRSLERHRLLSEALAEALKRAGLPLVVVVVVFQEIE